ncbi:MAG: VWA domain-containing protein, partial [Gemmataceae bacterium]|nr:VWA domain-containing protein [Gemmataceae bacterium]
MAARASSVSFLARAWFPASLAVLLLLTVPVLVLVVMHLFGADGAVNAWLEDTFQLSYELPLPWVFGLVLLLIPLLIVLLYFLKLKRKPLQVPSTFLWRKSIEDLHVNSLFQWLRENVLLLLQLLAVLLLLYAVMGFRFHGSTTRGQHYILLLDNSASMAATDVRPSRLEWARQEALKVIDAATEDSVGMVIVFNAKATTLQSYTTNKAKLRDAV